MTENSISPSASMPQSEAVSEVRAQNEREGGLASQQLQAWRRRIPMEDRIQMAKNMDGLIRRYQIAPSDLEWQSDYPTAVDFRNVLFRSRVSGTSNPGKKLTAYAATWIRLIDYIKKCLGSRDVLVSREYLVELLTRGTRFHPSVQSLDESKRVLLILEGIADKLAREFGLIAHYRNSSKLRADHFEESGRLLECKPFLGGHKVQFFERELGQLFGEQVLWDQLPEKQLYELTEAEWSEIRERLPYKELFDSIGDGLLDLREGRVNDGSSIYTHCTQDDLDVSVRSYFDLRLDSVLGAAAGKKLTELSDSEWARLQETKDIYFVSLGMLRYYVERWGNLRSEKQALPAYIHSSDFSLDALEQFPHALIGYFDYNLPTDVKPGILDSADPLWSSFIERGLSADIDYRELLKTPEGEDTASSLCFLTLVPDLEACRLMPYIFCGYDGSALFPVARIASGTDDDAFKIVAPFAPGETAIVRDALAIIWDDIDRVFDGLKSTAALVKERDPYHKRREEKQQKMDRLMNEIWA